MNVSMRQIEKDVMFSNMEEFNDRPFRPLNIPVECESVKNSQFRTISGYCNNLENPEQGRANQPFALLSIPFRSANSVRGLPNARLISSIVCNMDTDIPNERGLSELATFFGQFLDHTVTETSSTETEPFPIYVPLEDNI